MILGRGNMPNFAGTTFDVRQQASVALYVQLLQKPPSPGGWGLGYIGPVTEGLAGFAALGLLCCSPCGSPGARARSNRPRPARPRCSSPPPATRPARAPLGAASGPAAAPKLRLAPPPDPRPQSIRRPAPAAPRSHRPAGRPRSASSSPSPAPSASSPSSSSATARRGSAGRWRWLFLGLGFALAYWGRDLTSDEVEVGRYPLPPEPAPRRRRAAPPARLSPRPSAAPRPTRAGARSATRWRTAPRCSTRRRFLTMLLVGAASRARAQPARAGRLAGAQVARPASTAWRPGSRLVTTDGVPITRDRAAGRRRDRGLPRRPHSKPPTRRSPCST